MSKHVLIDVEFDQDMPDDDVRWHHAQIKRAVQDLAPDAVVTVRAAEGRMAA